MMPVLQGLDFSISEKRVVGFLGSNGAGKTTTIKCLLGLVTKDSGDIRVLSGSIQDAKIKNQIGYLPERPFFYRYLSAEEFLTFYAQLSMKISKGELDKRIDELLELVGLGHARKLLLNQFSKGMLQRVGMAQALVHRPKLLILDEPLSGLDPDGRMRMATVIKQVHSSGTSVFFSSHLLDDVEKLCQDLVVIRKGKIQYAGAKESFISRGQRNFSLSYRLGDQSFEETFSELEQVQGKIDQLRKEKATVVGLRPNSVSLEEAYKEFHSL